MNQKFFVIYLPFFLFLILGYLPFSAQAQSLERYEFESVHMGTTFRIAFYASDDSLAKAASDHAFGKVEDLNAILSDYKEDSELNRLSNQSGSSRWISVSDPLFQVICKGQEVAQKTDGAFDITVGPYVQLWRKMNRSYDPALPSQDILKQLSKSVGYKYIRLKKNLQAVKLLQPHMQLDAGGIAKGFAADEALKVLESHGIYSAFVDAGGDITLGNSPPHKRGWKINIQRYTQGRAQIITLLLSNKAIATSGDLFQHVAIEGKRYSHIVNPHTGIGLTNQSTVTVIAPNGITADSYASAVSVLGPKRGIAILKSESNISGFIQYHREGKIKYETSPDFEEFKINH